MKKIYPLVTGIFSLLFLSSCVYGRYLNNRYTEYFNIPEKDTILEANVGDTLTVQGMKTTIPAIKLNKNFTDAKLLKQALNCTLPAGTYYQYAQFGKDTVYLYTNGCLSSSSLYTNIGIFETPDKKYGIAVLSKASNGETIQKKHIGNSNNQKSFYFDEGQIEETTCTALNEPMYEQHIIYLGKSGNIVKFAYREFLNDYIRPAFTTEMQYDLSETNIIGYKNARIEILNATNYNIKYRLLEGFIDSIQ